MNASPVRASKGGGELSEPFLMLGHIGVARSHRRCLNGSVTFAFW